MITIRQNPSRSVASFSRNNLFRGSLFLAAALLLSSALSAQTPTPAATDTQAPAAAPAPADNQNGGRGNRGNRGNVNSEEMRARMSANLKEQFGVASDDEWNLIMERITKVNELRRSTMMGNLRGLMGAMGGFGGAGGQNGQGGRGNRQGGFGGASNPEVEALQTAITDKAPDAEIKARLERLREVRKENEANLTKAQEDLRAVLSVRQEAVAVVNGLLP